VAAVTGIDDRYPGILRGHERRPLLEVAHGDDVREAADHTYGIGHGLALGHGRRVGVRETDDAAAQLHHGRGETQARTGRGLVEERRSFFPLHASLYLARLAMMSSAKRNDLFGFGNRQVGRID